MDKITEIKQNVLNIVLELIKDELKDWDYTNTYAEEDRKHIHNFLQSMYYSMSVNDYDTIVYGEIDER